MGDGGVGAISGVGYLDHAATTAVRQVAVDALVTQSVETGNPSSLHASGRHSRRIVEESRESLAAELGVRPNDVVFTSGGTEADNLAIKGLYWSAVASDPVRRTIVISAIEHHAVLDAATWLADHEGAKIEWIPASGAGVVDVEWLQDYLASHAHEVALCTVMWVNNETGVIQPVDAAAHICEQFGIPFHCDGVQGAAWLAPQTPWRNSKSSLAISAHKFGGPVGVGALVINGVTPAPLLHGGGQEIDVRSGTIATALVASAAAAFGEAAAQRADERQRVAALAAALTRHVREISPDAIFVGEAADRVPNIVSVTFPGCQADALLMLLDASGVACSAGSACTAGVPRPSHVLLAMGVPADEAQATLRFSLGWNSTQADIEALTLALPAALDRARMAHRGRAQRGIAAGAP